MKKRLVIRYYKISAIRRFFKWLIDLIQKYNLDGSQDVTDGRCFVLWDLTKNAKRVPKSLQKQLTKSISKYKRDLKKHFAVEGYDLNADFYIHEVMCDVLGFNIQDNIRARLLKGTNINLKWSARSRDCFTLEKPKDVKEKV